jgi:hypothetical protein
MGVASVVGGLIGGKILKGVFGKKPKAAAPTPLPVPTRNLAAEAAAKNDVLGRRRGVLANAVLGMGGAEATGVGTKTKLGS